MSNILDNLTSISVDHTSTIYAKATPVTFTGIFTSNHISGVNVPYQEIWQFGDGDYSYDHTPTHTFNSKGIYEVSYSIVIPNSANGHNDEVKTIFTTLSVYNYIEDNIRWVDGAPSTYQSVPQNIPFIIQLSSSCVDDILPSVKLYSRGSKSQPWQEPQQKWSHLKPQWKFTDLSGNTIHDIVISDYTPIIIDRYGNRVSPSIGTIVGLSAEIECLYVDDLPSQNLDNSISPITLVATLVTSSYNVDGNVSYANSDISSETVHTIKSLTPDHLKITVNGITPLNDIIWKNAYTPYMVTVHPAAPYQDVILKSFPLENFIVNSFNQSVTNIPASSVTFTDTIQLDRYDDDGFDVGGYYRGAFYSSVSANTACVLANGVVMYSVLAEPFGAWVSNPKYNQLVYLTVKDLQTIQEFTSSVYTIPNSQIYGIVRVPGDINDTSWCTDPANDTVYRVSRNFGIDRTFNLSTYPECSAFIYDNDFGVTPTGIALDSNKNVWVTLFDAGSTIKLDTDTGSILCNIYPPVQSTYLSVPGVSGFGGEYTVQANKVDIDKLDNVWVSYSHPLSSFICKYSNTGTFISKIDLPIYSQPHDIIIDGGNNLWVTLTNESTGTNGTLMKFSNDCTQLSAISGFRVPSYITLDFNQNPWFIHGYNYITKINTNTGSTTTYLMSSTTLSTDPISSVIINDRLYDQELGGISCDWFNRIWVLNSYDNRVYMVAADAPESRSEVQISPYSNDFRYSLQGSGDWHGLQWYNKFQSSSPLSAIGSDVTISLSGISNIFSVKDFESEYDIRKINEDFDGVNKIRDITLQPNINRNDILFSNIIAPIAGSYDGDPLILGNAIYEKIANFVGNHGDVDTCNIQQLQSLHQLINIPIDQYNFSYPSDIKRLMDILSVSLCKLKPTRDLKSKDFKQYNVAGSGKNIGKLLDTTTYIASAGQNVIFNIKYSNNYEKIELTPITVDVLQSPTLSSTYSNYPLSSFPLSSFPLSGYTGWGLDVPIANYYYVYEYVSGTDNTQVGGIIDWENTHTTLNENISSIDDWYKDGGIVDLIFNYYIFKGLGLIRD